MGKINRDTEKLKGREWGQPYFQLILQFLYKAFLYLSYNDAGTHGHYNTVFLMC